MLQESQFKIVHRTVAVFGDDDFCDTGFARLLLVVIVVAIDEHNDVGVLFNST